MERRTLIQSAGTSSLLMTAAGVAATEETGSAPDPRSAHAEGGSRSNPHRFYMVMGVVAILVAAVGFGGSFGAVVTGRKTFTLLVHIHAAVFSAWLVLYLVQAGLVSAGRTAIHRWLGIAAVALALAVVGVGYLTAIAAARRGYDLTLDDRGHDPLRFLVFTLGDLVSFTALVAAGLWYRRRPQVHKRLMLLVTVGPMMSAALVHLWAQFPVSAAKFPLFLVSMAALLFAVTVYDRVTLRRFHPVSLWVPIVLFAWGNFRALVIGPSDVWHRFAAWLIR